MRALARLFLLVPFALLFAVPAGMLALAAVSVADPVVAAFSGDVVWTGMGALLDRLAEVDDPEPLVVHALAGASRAAAMLLIAPPLFVGLVGEIAGLRSLAWYAAGTGAVAAAIPWITRSAERLPSAEEAHITLALFLAGAAAGFTYWVVAGRSAGAPRRPEPSAPSPGS